MTLQLGEPILMSFPTNVFCFYPCRSDKCPTGLSASPQSSCGWTSRDPSCSCSGASLLTTTWISAQKPQPESPLVVRQTVTPAVPRSLPAFPSRYRQPPSSRGRRERASAFQPGDVGVSHGPWRGGISSQNRPRRSEHSVWRQCCVPEALPGFRHRHRLCQVTRPLAISLSNVFFLWSCCAKVAQVMPGKQEVSQTGTWECQHRT